MTSELILNKLRHRESVADSFLVEGDKRRLVMEGTAVMLENWLEAVGSGYLDATPESIKNTRESVAELKSVLSQPLPTGDNRN